MRSGCSIAACALGQPRRQVILAVVVHQEADAAAIHAVDRQVAAEAAVLRLQHEAVAAQRHDRPPPSPPAHRRSSATRRLRAPRPPRVAAARKAMRPANPPAAAPAAARPGCSSRAVTARAAARHDAPAPACPAHPRRHRRVQPRRRPAGAVRGLGHHMPPGVRHQRMAIDRARLPRAPGIARCEAAATIQHCVSMARAAAAPPNGPCRSAG